VKKMSQERVRSPELEKNLMIQSLRDLIMVYIGS